MPKTIPVPKATPDLTAPETRPDPSPRPERALTGPLSWVLGGATPARGRPAAGNGERRREPAHGRQPVSAEARKRRNPSSRFRG